MSETANPNGLCWDDPDPGGERDYSMMFGYFGEGRERMAAIQWGDGDEAGLVLVPFDVLLSAVTQGWEGGEPDYGCMYRALVCRLVEIADEIDTGSGRTFAEYNRDRLADYDRVALAHKPNIGEEDDG